jgi:hypothetical protein
MEYVRTAVQIFAALGGLVSLALYFLDRGDPVRRVEHLVAATFAMALLAAAK